LYVENIDVDSYIGIAFNYENEDNYMALEIGNFDNDPLMMGKIGT